MECRPRSAAVRSDQGVRRQEDKAQVYPYCKASIDPSLAGEVAILQTNIDNYVQQNALPFIAGSKDITREWVGPTEILVFEGPFERLSSARILDPAA